MYNKDEINAVVGQLNGFTAFGAHVTAYMQRKEENDGGFTIGIARRIFDIALSGVFEPSADSEALEGLEGLEGDRKGPRVFKDNEHLIHQHFQHIKKRVVRDA